ncbi:hypothetical protein D9M69_608690 [compost metagenome]
MRVTKLTQSAIEAKEMLSRNYWLGVEYGQQVVRMKCGTGLESETRRQQLMNMRVPERLLGCRLKLTLGGVGEFFHSHETILVTSYPLHKPHLPIAC